MHTNTGKNGKSNGSLSVVGSDFIDIDAKLSKKIPLALIDSRPLMLASFTNFIHHTTADYTINPFNNLEELVNQVQNEINAVEIIIFNIGYKRVDDKIINDGIIKLKASLPVTPLVLITDCEESGCILQAINLGVQGYVTTSLMPSVVIAALNLVFEGGIFAPIRPFMNELNHKNTATEGSEGLHLPDTLYFTPRQLEVLEHVKLGEPNKIIAYKLGMQECTVKVHVRDIMKKLNATNRTQLVYKAEHINPEVEPQKQHGHSRGFTDPSKN
ncbi:DNA-binding response regulator [Crenothrix sp.]|uniref:response regulator transcription factor n=1 Tax=Crenothrix sp. TaxID=3100433 RepID=UPI00374DC882